MIKTYIRSPMSPTAGALGLFAACATIFAPAAIAGPIQYTITFTATSGPAPTAGSFSYDSSQQLGSPFSSFLVTWDSITFDVTASANAPLFAAIFEPCPPTRPMEKHMRASPPPNATILVG